MIERNFGPHIAASVLAFSSFLLAGCGAQSGTANVNISNSGSSGSNSTANVAAANSANTNSAPSVTVSESKEPDQYQATVTLKIEAIGAQNMTMPSLSANVARNSADRRMEFTMPAGGRVVFLDKGGKNYLILPEKKQYAELDRNSLGFDVRRMLMPEQIVEQVKSVQGMQRVGDEKYNGRDVIKYRYAAVANTQSQAGQVATESFLLVDKLTGLPLRSETVSQTGANVQGYSGMRIITEISDIKAETSPDIFAEPTSFQKIESEQVRGQVDLIFNSVAMLIGQMIKQVQPAGSPAAPAR